MVVSFSHHSYEGRGGQADWFERSEGSGECIVLLIIYWLNIFLTYVHLTLTRFGFKISARRPSDLPPKAQLLQAIPYKLLSARRHRAHPSSFTVLQMTRLLVTGPARDTQSIRGPAVSVVGAWMDDFFLLRMRHSL